MANGVDPWVCEEWGHSLGSTYISLQCEGKAMDSILSVLCLVGVVNRLANFDCYPVCVHVISDNKVCRTASGIKCRSA